MEASRGQSLPLPSPGQVCVSVLRACGSDGPTVWRHVCTQAKVPPLSPGYSEAQLGRIAAELSSRSGVLSVVGRSLAVRLQARRLLSRSAT